MLETDAQTDFVEIRCAAGLPGFPHVHVFQLKPWGPPGSPYLLLTSVDDADVGFVVVPPWVFSPGHRFDVDDETAERLGLIDAEEAIVLAVVTRRDRPADATLNL